MGWEVDKELAEGTTAASIVAGQSDAAAHPPDGAASVVSARNVKESGDFADTVAFAADQPGWRSLETQLGGRQSACAEFVFEPVNADIPHFA
jgi:hypothetical protein